MELKISIEKRHTAYILASLLILTWLNYAIAYGGNNPAVVGHNAEEIGEGTIAGTLTISGGSVGIGTTNPGSSKLKVEGNVYATGSLQADGGIIVDGKTMISGTGYYHTARSTDNTHYGYFEVRREDNKRGAYFGSGNGGSRVNLYLDNADTLYITGGDVEATGNIRANDMCIKSGTCLSDLKGYTGSVLVWREDCACYGSRDTYLDISNGLVTGVRTVDNYCDDDPSNC